MITIHKYPLDRVEKTMIDIPHSSKFLHFGYGPNEELSIWFQVDDQAWKTHRFFRLIGTGWSLDPRWVYMQSIVVHPYVWHLYELTAAPDA